MELKYVDSYDQLGIKSTSCNFKNAPACHKLNVTFVTIKQFS